MTTADAAHVHELEQLLDEVRVAARTARGTTRGERERTRATLVPRLRAALVGGGLADDALQTWIDELDRAEAGDIELFQELLYGLDALLRVHLWREAEVPLRLPPARSPSDV